MAAPAQSGEEPRSLPDHFLQSCCTKPPLAFARQELVCAVGTLTSAAGIGPARTAHPADPSPLDRKLPCSTSGWACSHRIHNRMQPMFQRSQFLAITSFTLFTTLPLVAQN